VPVRPVPIPVHDVVYGGFRDVGLLFNGAGGNAGPGDYGTGGPVPQAEIPIIIVIIITIIIISDMEVHLDQVWPSGALPP